MKNIIKIMFILAFLIFNMQVSGQIYLGGFNDFENNYFSNVQFPVFIEMPTMDEVGGPSNPPAAINRTLMTYNINKRMFKYDANGRLIKSTGAHACAVQEVVRTVSLPFARLKNSAEMDGVFVRTMCLVVGTYGNALLWKTSVVGSPLKIVKERVDTSNADDDPRRGYIIAEFSSFIFVSTHLGGDSIDKKKILNKIFNENIIKNSNKRIFIAGDLNFQPKNSPELRNLFAANGFELLNSEERDTDDDSYYHSAHRTTYESKKMIDLIYGKIKNPPKYEVTWRGVPSGVSEDLSDHKPYVVKVKFK